MLIDKVLKIYPSPDSSATIDSVLSSLISKEADKNSSLTVVGVIGYDTTTFLALIVASAIPATLCDSMTCTSSQCSIYALYDMAIKSVYLVLVSDKGARNGRYHYSFAS